MGPQRFDDSGPQRLWISIDSSMKSSLEGLEGKLSPIHRSTSTSTTASSEDR